MAPYHHHSAGHPVNQMIYMPNNLYAPQYTMMGGVEGNAYSYGGAQAFEYSPCKPYVNASPKRSVHADKRDIRILKIDSN